MIYSNTKLNLTNCRYREYGSYSVYRRRHSGYWIQAKNKFCSLKFLLLPISNSNLGMENKLKTNCGTIGYNRTKYE